MANTQNFSTKTVATIWNTTRQYMAINSASAIIPVQNRMSWYSLIFSSNTFRNTTNGYVGTVDLWQRHHLALISLFMHHRNSSGEFKPLFIADSSEFPCQGNCLCTHGTTVNTFSLNVHIYQQSMNGLMLFRVHGSRQMPLLWVQSWKGTGNPCLSVFHHVYNLCWWWQHKDYLCHKYFFFYSQGEPGFQGPTGPRGAPGTGLPGEKVDTN